MTIISNKRFITATNLRQYELSRFELSYIRSARYEHPTKTLYELTVNPHEN